MLLFNLIFVALFSGAVEGDFVFSGNMDVVQHRKIQVVPAMGEAQLSKIKDLKKQGYQCAIRGRFYKCTLFVNPPEWPTKKTEADHLRIHFGKKLNKKMIAEGEVVVQFQVDQRVTVDGKVYNQSLYTIMDSGLEKVRVTNTETRESLYFLIEDKRVSSLQFPTESKSRFEWEEFMIAVHYEVMNELF